VGEQRLVAFVVPAYDEAERIGDTLAALRSLAPALGALDLRLRILVRRSRRSSYTQQLLLDAYHKGMRFTHVPVAFRERTTGRSFVSLKYPLKALPQIGMVLVGVRPMKLFAPIGLGFMAVAAAVFAVEVGLWLARLSVKPVVHVNLVLGAGLFGLQTIFFGVLAQLIVERRD
jgi:hypothetical protein